MTWVAVAVAGGAIVGGALSADASKKAGQIQANAANNATNAQLQMFNTINNQQLPYRQTGTTGLNQLGGYLGLPGYSVAPQTYSWNGQTYQDQQSLRDAITQNYVKESGGLDPNQAPVQLSIDNAVKGIVANTPKAEGDTQTGSLMHQFGPEDLKTNLAPNYDFMLGQGQQATTNLANLSGGAFSGNTLKAINDYTQNYASNAYQNAFSNYNTNQTNIFNRLASIAGIGQTANAQTAQAGVPIATGVGNSMQNAGASQAAGLVGSTNALTGGINNAASWYAMSKMMSPNTAPAAPTSSSGLDV